MSFLLCYYRKNDVEQNAGTNDQSYDARMFLDQFSEIQISSLISRESLANYIYVLSQSQQIQVSLVTKSDDERASQKPKGFRRMISLVKRFSFIWFVMLRPSGFGLVFVSPVKVST